LDWREQCIHGHNTCEMRFERFTFFDHGRTPVLMKMNIKRIPRRNNKMKHTRKKQKHDAEMIAI
jgi:hypothetical protein